MKRVAEASSVLEADEMRAFHVARGNDAIVYGAETFSTPGVNPLAFPSVWIGDDADIERAQSILQDFRRERAAAARGGAWTCVCGERHEAQFEVCWRCGAVRRD